MARIRNIKPSFFRHEKLQDLESLYPGQHIMLTYIGLWTQCDTAGIFPWKTRLLKLDILPFIDYSLDHTLQILQENGFIQRYQAHGSEWGFIPSFSEHQRFSGKELNEGERYPKPDDNDAGEVIGKREGSEREARGKREGTQERSTGKDNREGERVYAREAGSKEKAPPKKTPPSPTADGWLTVDIDAELEEIKKGDLCLERFVRQCAIPAERYETFVENFALKVKTEKKPYSNRADFRSHFFNWSRSEYDHEQKKKSPTPNGNNAPPKRATIVHYQNGREALKEKQKF